MNKYVELRRRQQEEFNKFPLHFAFGKEQICEKFSELGLDPHKDLDKIECIPGTGEFILTKDKLAYMEMSNRHREELISAIKEDKNGDGFIFDMFTAELSNCEFNYDEDIAIEGALSALGLTLRKVTEDPVLNAGFEKAKKQLRKIS